jgi:hypothetical protein
LRIGTLQETPVTNRATETMSSCHKSPGSLDSLACAQVVPDGEEASCISCAVHHGSVLKEVAMTVCKHPCIDEMEELARMAEVIIRRHAGAHIPQDTGLGLTAVSTTCSRFGC